MKNKFHSINRKAKSGQILVMYAIMLLVLVAIIGLAIDVGYAYVSYARLRRAVDAAALDASNQIKEGYSGSDLETSAEQFLRLNDVNDPTAKVRFCNPESGFEAWHDPNMCTTPPRKLVSVTATSQVPTFFMAALGFDSFPISASAESEAASVDVILVIDISISQTYDRAGPPDSSDLGVAATDPYWCNTVNLGTSMPGGCLPFENIKNAAYAFVEEGVYLDYDRVGIVTFSRLATRVLELTHKEDDILTAIENLEVDQLEECPPYDKTDPGGSMGSKGEQCRRYDINPSDSGEFPDITNEASWSENYGGTTCPQRRLYNDGYTGYYDQIADCGNTNSGAGLLAAIDMFQDPANFRNESAWVVIFLTDGVANIGYDEIYVGDTPSIRYCPNILNYCTDKIPGNGPGKRHSAITEATQYDPMDYAKDAMDNLFSNQVYVFAIGQGKRVDGPDAEAEAVELINYAGDHPSGNGASYFGSSEAKLREIFLAIANRISTRLTR